MSSHFSNLLLLLKRLAIPLLLFSLCRLLFYLFNYTYFSDISILELLKIFLAGLRFDIAALVIVNSIFILFTLFPFINKGNRIYQNILKLLFVITNSIALLANCIDFLYFKFTLKRTTAELFFIRDDVGNLLPQYLRDYWYIALIWLMLTFLLFRLYPKTKLIAVPSSIKKYVIEILIFICVSGLAVIAGRGGVQLKPLRIIAAAEYTSSRNIPLVINTPFSIIKSLNSTYITNYNFYTQHELEKLSSFTHTAHTGEMKKENVVIIILESFSREYIGSLNNGKGYTPFLDSLMQHSLVFENGYANARKSIDGIPAVIAGIPSLMENPYLTSVYGSNQISGLGNLLKNKGYATSFFHGGSNGTMGFDVFTKIAGFDTYYGRKEYNNDKDFDGNWGIYDEPFFQYFANELNKNTSPFCAAIFSLSSHHPYSIPEKYKNKFPKGTLEIHESIGYADYSLRKFFATASHMPWFKNTLFVITADHTSLSASPYYQTKSGAYAIPIIFYKADESIKGNSKITAQQIDILPSVLDELNFNENYFAYGNSLFDSTSQHFAINYINEVYQTISENHSLLFDGEKVVGYYDLQKDSLLTTNLINENAPAQKQQEQQLKAFIQHFNATLIENKMTIPSQK